MIPLRHLFASTAFVALMFSGCGSPHGQPRAGSDTLAPSQVLDFATLYAENCAGCHGAEGRGGAAIALADPVYLAIADDASIREVIAEGVSGTAMPAFAESAGGMLTDKQIEVITNEIRSRWSRRGILDAANPPSYGAKSTAMPCEAQSRTKLTAHPATARAAAEDRRAARSLMILFSRWSAIRVCALWSSPAVLN